MNFFIFDRLPLLDGVGYEVYGVEPDEFFSDLCKKIQEVPNCISVLHIDLEDHVKQKWTEELNCRLPYPIDVDTFFLDKRTHPESVRERIEVDDQIYIMKFGHMAGLSCFVVKVLKKE